MAHQTAFGVSRKPFSYADMVELADTLDLGSNAVRCAGSSPVIRTRYALAVKDAAGAFFVDKPAYLWYNHSNI